MVGKTLGHYEILEPLGAGGMGEVYRARDTTLKREVAIKVLPEDLAADPDRLARLEREAHLLATLNHSNIATIHALEEEEGTRFLVLELVKGESLEQRLSKGPLEVEKALEVCKQIAEALEAAHGEGIIHRDLKPANVLITDDGRAKVLDFGIAKSMQVDAEVAATARATKLTVAGTLVGTPSYMSPEQVRGEPVDKRADIWAFGCLLFEMLTAKSAFARETLADTLAAIVDQDPDFDALPEVTPPGIRVLLRRCLKKRAGARLHDVADARIEIEEASAGSDGRAAGRPEAVGQARAGTLNWQLLGVGTTGLVVGGLLVAGLMTVSSRGASVAEGARHLDLFPPEDVSLNSGDWWRRLAVSPNGQQVVFTGRGAEDNVLRLYRRDLGDDSVVPVPGTEIVGSVGSNPRALPFFHPDGTELGFFSGGRLKTVRLDGGSPQDIASAPRPWGGTWGPDGTIVYVPNVAAGLWSISVDDREPKPLTQIGAPGGPDYGAHWRPSFLPDGRSVLFDIWSGDMGHATAIADVETGEWEVIVDDAARPQYVPTGHLLFGRGRGVWAVPFDVSTHSVGESAVPVINSVGPEGNYPVHFSASVNGDGDGVLVYLPRGEEPQHELVEVDLLGAATPLDSPPRYYHTPRYSPDGSKIAVQISEPGNSGVWVFDVGEAKTLTRVTASGEGENHNPSWNSDGLSLVFATNRSGSWEQWIQPVDGPGEAELLMRQTSSAFLFFAAHGMTHDDQYLIGTGYISDRPEIGNTSAVISVKIDDPTQVRVLVPRVGGFERYSSTPSPSGNMVAYVSTEDGQPVVYVTTFPERGTRRAVSSGAPASEPVWSPDGQRLFYLQGQVPDQDMKAVDLIDEATLTFSRARTLFPVRGYRGSNDYTFPRFDISLDGKSFVMVRDVGEGLRPTHINVILNWFEELKRLVPTGR